jgi:hypothetical protein
MRWSRILIAIWIALMIGALLSPVLDSPPEDGRVRWTVDVSLAFYALAAARMLLTPRDAWRSSAQTNELRLIWTLAWLAYFIHVIVAFNDIHRWSHAGAVDHTRERSGYGSGIYVSHLFTVVWGLDVSWCWFAAENYRSRPAWIGCSVHGFLAFVTFNAVVVFESGPIRWAGFAGAVGLLTLLVRRFWMDKKIGRLTSK